MSAWRRRPKPWVRDDWRYSTATRVSQVTSEAFTRTLDEQRVTAHTMDDNPVRYEWTTSSSSGCAAESFKYGMEVYLRALPDRRRGRY